MKQIFSLCLFATFLVACQKEALQPVSPQQSKISNTTWDEVTYLPVVYFKPTFEGVIDSSSTATMPGDLSNSFVLDANLTTPCDTCAYAQQFVVAMMQGKRAYQANNIIKASIVIAQHSGWIVVVDTEVKPGDTTLVFNMPLVHLVTDYTFPRQYSVMVRLVNKPYSKGWVQLKMISARVLSYQSRLMLNSGLPVWGERVYYGGLLAPKDR